MASRSTPPLFIFTLLLLCLASCDLGNSSDDDSEQYASCQPLATSEVAIDLGVILAIGQDSGDTIYVVDLPADGGQEHRLFRSDGDVLVRKDITGSGQGTSPDGSKFYVFSFDEGEQVHSLAVEKAKSGEMKIALAQGQYKLSIEEVAAAGEYLQVLDESAIDSMTLKNLAGEVFVEYLARIGNGELAVVIRPEHDWSYEDFRLFMGLQAEMKELEVIEVARQRDGGTTDITFRRGSTTATMHFGIDNLTEWGECYLETGDSGTLSVERLEPDTHDLPGFTYFCLTEDQQDEQTTP